MKKFNINDNIYIQINDQGWAHLKNTKTQDYIDNCIISPNYRKIINGDVWYRLQCHQVFSLFPTDVGIKILFNSNIMINDEDLNDVELNKINN